MHGTDDVTRLTDNTANAGGTQGPDVSERFKEAISFLEQLRPGGPWVLTAITPDGPAVTVTAGTAAETDSFIGEHNGKRNIYYSVNRVKYAMSKKAKKTDIAAVEYLLGDLDPRDDETPEAAKERYLKQLNWAFEPKATAIVDSGNGIQCLWRLDPSITLGDASESIIADVEARSAALMLRLGSKAGTQNIDRILRLPGTINLPNRAKRDAGRVECQTKLISFNGACYPLASFPLPKKPDDESIHAHQEHEEEAHEGGDKLERIIRLGENGEFKGDRSSAVWFVVCEMLRRGTPDRSIVSTLLDRANKISAHVNAQEKPREYAERQIAKAKAKYPNNKTQGASKITRRPVEFIGWRTGSAPPIEYLIDRMIKRRGAGVIGGQPKDGKSLIATNLTASVLTGQSFAGRLTMRTGGALWLLNEGQDEIDDNVQQAVRAMGGNIENQPVLRVEGAQYLQEPDAEEWLDSIIKEAKARLAKEFGVELVLMIIDTIISVGAYDDDNSRALTSAVLQKVHNVSMTNDLFSLAIDHVGKDKKRGIMGSIGKIATADVVLIVDVTKKNEIVISRKMILHLMRGGKAGTVNYFELKETSENAHGDAFVTIEWQGIEQVNLSSICNLLLRCITECQDPGNLFTKKDLRKVKEEDARARFYEAYDGDSDEANRSAFRRAKGQAILNGLIKAEGGLVWLV